jgi:hypothetical protein
MRRIFLALREFKFDNTSTYPENSQRFDSDLYTIGTTTNNSASRPESTITLDSQNRFAFSYSRINFPENRNAALNANCTDCFSHYSIPIVSTFITINS